MTKVKELLYVKNLNVSQVGKEDLITIVEDVRLRIHKGETRARKKYLPSSDCARI